MSVPADGAGASPAHLDALTGIRGIAAWLVVLYHIRLSLTGILPAWTIAAMAKGYLAVDLFFILSGFVLWYNYADRLRTGGLGEAGAFLWRRIARIWPLHAVILMLFVAFALVLATTGRSTSGYPFAELPLHVLLVQNWGFTAELSWNHPAWSISTEMAAYLLFPLVALAAPWDRLRPAALLALALALLGAIHLLFAVNGHATLGEDIVGLGLWRCLLEFALGNVLCLLWLRWRGGRALVASAAAAVCGAVLAAGWLLALPETAFVPASFAAGLMALALGRGGLARLLGSPLPRYLGEISYSTYLAHFLLFIVFKLMFVDASLQIGWAGLAGFLAMVLAASAGFYHLVEKPAQRALNRHRPRWPLRDRSVPAE
jgi:peptidoglycan/LPS O-acetylase OafA/YrhL